MIIHQWLNLNQVQKFKNVANIQRVATPLEENNKEIGEVSGGNLTSNYMPGVFDKLDTQIFGKILPHIC